MHPPLSDFTGELLKLKHDLLGGRKPGTPAYTLTLEMAEMESAMAALLADGAARKQWLQKYRLLRAAMISDADASQYALPADEPVSEKDVAELWKESQDMLSAAPQDVRLYLEGAMLYLQNATAPAAAREKWQAVLALPEAQRKLRSTWAAWMLFRTEAEKSQQRGRWLALIRQQVREGYADCLHLGVEATYILGRPQSDLPEKAEVSPAAWKRAAYQRVLLGHSRSLETVRHDRWVHLDWSEELAAETLGDPLLRQAQLLHLIDSAEGILGWSFGSHGEGQGQRWEEQVAQWLASFEAAKIEDQREATLLAWALYNAAKFDAAERWLKIAPKDDVVALSLRGKLSVLKGRKKEAVKSFASMAKELPLERDHARAQMEVAANFEVRPLDQDNYEAVRRHHLLADYGRAQLAVNDFSGALLTFARTDFWEDTAFIAERLVSVEELLTLKRNGTLIHYESPELLDNVEGSQEPIQWLSTLIDRQTWDTRSGGGTRLDYLLARRLARARYFKDAEKYMPKDVIPAFKMFTAAYRKGHDAKLPKQVRADALWEAAQIYRLLGMELMGFEEGPDWFVHRGSFESENMAELRLRPEWKPEWIDAGSVLDEYKPVLTATADEKWRLKHYAPKIDKRFQYRYLAADLAWKAAALMPDNDPKTAEVLCIAGGWLKLRDPKAADRFYKALVNRNPTVPLAVEAEKKRWFPAVAWDFDRKIVVIE